MTASLLLDLLNAIPPSIPGQWGYTALIWAAYEGRIAAVRALLEAGADINLQNKVGSQT